MFKTKKITPPSVAEIAAAIRDERAAAIAKKTKLDALIAAAGAPNG